MNYCTEKKQYFLKPSTISLHMEGNKLQMGKLKIRPKRKFVNKTPKKIFYEISIKQKYKYIKKKMWLHESVAKRKNLSTVKFSTGSLPATEQ